MMAIGIEFLITFQVPQYIIFWAYMGLEKAFYRVHRNGLLNVLQLCGLGGRLLKGVNSLYVNSRSCVVILFFSVGPSLLYHLC